LQERNIRGKKQSDQRRRIKMSKSKKRFIVRSACPACAGCGTLPNISPEVLREKFIGDEKEIDILCPMCGTKHKATVEEDKSEGKSGKT
jgi:ssDNA-binding Zn-finger/Zn-ribbon topoisomerase 1